MFLCYLLFFPAPNNFINPSAIHLTSDIPPWQFSSNMWKSRMPPNCPWSCRRFSTTTGSKITSVVRVFISWCQLSGRDERRRHQSKALNYPHIGRARWPRKCGHVDRDASQDCLTICQVGIETARGPAEKGWQTQIQRGRRHIAVRAIRWLSFLSVLLLRSVPGLNLSLEEDTLIRDLVWEWKDLKPCLKLCCCHRDVRVIQDS